MQKITVVGKDSAAKSAVIVALDSTLQIIDLYPEEFSAIDTEDSDLVIYIAEPQPDREIFERLRKNYKGLVLISRAKSVSSDLFISIAAFESFSIRRVLKEIRFLRDFIDRFFSDRAGLSDIQRLVIGQLAKSSSEGEVLSALAISRRTYYVVLSELRALYGVSKNWQLVQSIQNMRQIHKG